MDWTQFRGATCLPDCWCEATRVGSWILEPVNTWTNLVFIFSGLFFLLRSEIFLQNTNGLNAHTQFPKLYGFALLFVGGGSFFYHASQTFMGQWFDVFGMYLVSIFYIAYNFFRLKKFNLKQFKIFYFVTCIVLGIIIYYIPETRRWLFGVSIAFTFVQSLYVQKKLQAVINSHYLILAVGSYITAQTFWILDKNKIWCNPYAWMNGHGLWHILTGIAAIFAYLYFNSERGLKEQVE
jgi:uncharacterized membrane protein SirB2